MRFLRFRPRKSLVISLILTSALLGMNWHHLRTQRVRLEESRVNAESQALGAASRSGGILSQEAAGALLRRMAERLDTVTINGLRKPEEVPPYMFLPDLESLGAPDLALLLEGAEREPDESLRNGLRHVLFQFYAPLDPSAALQTAAQWPPEFTDEWIAPVLEAWHSQNGDALRWFEKLKTRRPGEWAVSSRALRATDESPAGSQAGGKPAPEPVPASLAQAWAETSRRNEELEPTNWTGHALAPVVTWASASGQWEEAWRQLGDLPTEHKQQSARWGLLKAWSEQDWRGWLAWERQHPERRTPDTYLGFSATLTGAFTHMQNRLTMNEHPDGPPDAAELGAFLEECLISEPSPASADLTLQTSMDLVETWVKADPENASAWLDRQKPGPQRDLAAEALAKATIGEEPTSALAWAASIADPTRREAALLANWKAWRALEPAPADAWVDQHFPELRSRAAAAAHTRPAP